MKQGAGVSCLSAEGGCTGMGRAVAACPCKGKGMAPNQAKYLDAGSCILFLPPPASSVLADADAFGVVPKEWYHVRMAHRPEIALTGSAYSPTYGMSAMRRARLIASFTAR